MDETGASLSTQLSPPKYIAKIFSAVRVATACVVRVGFGPPIPFANAELSAINSRLTSRASPFESNTELPSSRPKGNMQYQINCMYYILNARQFWQQWMESYGDTLSPENFNRKRARQASILRATYLSALFLHRKIVFIMMTKVNISIRHAQPSK